MCFVQIYNLYSLESREPICYICICLFLSIFVKVSLHNADSDCVKTFLVDLIFILLKGTSSLEDIAYDMTM